VLVRHGRTQWNGSHRFQGHTDVPLDDVGHAQAQRAADRLVTLGPARVASSDLSRAVATAEPLARRAGLAVVTDPALRETHGGRWEGLFDTQLREDPDYLDWSTGADVPAGGAETRSQVADRAVPAVLRQAAHLERSATLVVVTHGGTIRCVVGRLLELPVDRWRSLGGVANGCWSVLEEGRFGWRLTEHNAGSLPEPVLGDDR
jgi:probable phosphoglycerate mutase